MVSRNVLLLAAALQVPVTVWLQGCKSDKKEKPSGGEDESGSGNSDGGNGTNDGSETSKPEIPEKLQLNRINVQESFQNILDKKDVFKWRTDDHIYQDTKVATATWISTLPLDHSGEVGGKKTHKSNSRFGIPGHSHDYLQEEFFREISSVKVGRSRQTRHPFLMDLEEFVLLTERHGAHHVMDARSLYNKAAAETYIATGVSPEKNHKKVNMEYAVVTEVYSAWQDGIAAPLGVSNHVATTLLPLSSNPEFWYYIVQRAFSQICFLNASIRSTPSKEQTELHRQMLDGPKKEKVVLDIWTHLEDTRDNANQRNPAKATKDTDIVDTGFGSNLPRSHSENSHFISEAQKGIQSLVESIRADVTALWNTHGSHNKLPVASVDWTTANGKKRQEFSKGDAFVNEQKFVDMFSTPWKWESWKKDDPRHYEQLLQMALGNGSGQVNDALFKKFEQLHGWIRLLYKDHDKIPAPTNKAINAAHKAGDLSALDTTTVGWQATYSKKAITRARWCPSGYSHIESMAMHYTSKAMGGVGSPKFDVLSFAFEGWSESNYDSSLTGNALVEQEAVQTMCIPTGIYEALIRPTQFPRVVPKPDEDWDDFAEKINVAFQSNDSVDRDVVYYAPKLGAKDSLEDYLVKEIVITMPEKTHAHIHAVTMLATYHAWDVAVNGDRHSQKYNNAHTQGVLASPVIKEWDPESTNSRWHKGKYQPAVVDVTNWHADLAPATFVFLTNGKQAESYEDIATRMSKSDEVDVSGSVDVKDTEIEITPQSLDGGVHANRFAQE